MAEDKLSSQIYHSRDNIRNQIADEMKSYLELENVDLTKSSFLSYLVNLISTLTGNLMFYQISVYKEFFLTTAQLSESILNLSAFLGYNTGEATYATVSPVITMPFGFDDPVTTFNIPTGHKFYADDIEFQTYYETDITVTNNAAVQVVITEGSTIYNLPVIVDTTANFEFSFALPLRQYKITEQEFQIDEDLQTYQFSTLDVPIEGKVAALQVEERVPGSSSWQLYTEFDSLYLMSSLDYGYVSRRTGFGRRLYFGNGLIGHQPTPGSTIRVTIQETEGAGGNIIAGSLKTGDRIYNVTDAGITQVVNYTIVNTSPAIGGEDEEGLEEIRSNSIASLTALGRLVTYNDYTHTDVVVEDAPISSNSLAILKRSDVRVNEIILFTTLLFGDDLVPTRNAWHTIDDGTAIISTAFLPRGTVLDINGEDYITLFDITVDSVHNRTAYYHYIMYEVQQTPLRVTSFGSAYQIIATNLVVLKSGSQAIYRLYYYTDEPDYATTSCEMEILETTDTFAMTNNTIDKYFEYVFDPYTDVPEGQLTYFFTISTLSETVGRWQNSIIFRQSLDDFMLSNVTVDTDTTAVTIYDIPVVLKSYYDGINQRDFELQVLQTMMQALTFEDYRMLTDFTNVKFANTYGLMTGMQQNTVTKSSVLDIEECALPSFPSLGDRYIVSGDAVPADHPEYDDWIAECTDATNVVWFYFEPTSDDIVIVENRGKKYIYTGSEWVVPEYAMPLQIEFEVFKDPLYPGSVLTIAQNVKDALLDAFTSRFGVNATFYRSEFIDVAQDVEGVSHVHLLKPESDIFFEFDLVEDFTQEELLKYGPEYIYFEEDSITIKVFE